MLSSWPGAASAQDDEEAHGLYIAGAAAFAAGQYDEALVDFQRSFELSSRPQLLYNIGQSADRARHDSLALDSFRRYLASSTEIHNRAEVEARIHILEQAVAERQRLQDASTAHASEPSPTEPSRTAATLPTSAPPTSEGPDVGGLVLTIAGGVLVVAGVVLLSAGVPDLGGPREGELYDSTRGRQDLGTGLTASGAVALGLGTIGVIVGAIVLASASSPRSTAWRFGPGGLSLSF